MKNFAKTLLAIAFAAGLSTSAFATPVNLSGPESPNLQSLINQLYTNAGTSTALAPNVANESSQVNEGGQFQIEASGGTISALVFEVAGHKDTNSFGIYDLANASNRIELFSGLKNPFYRKSIYKNSSNQYSFDENFESGPTYNFGSSLFGYYLHDGVNNLTFFSEASRNGGEDHMVMYRGDGDMIKLSNDNKTSAGQWGASSFIMGWEDLPFASADKDYQDMVVYVESISVPEPGSLALLGLGLAGLGALSRRRQQAA